MSASHKQILVVDNNPVILRLMEHFLTSLGHHPTCVSDVFGCLDALVENTPEVIFIDLVMPRIGGEDLCRILRNMDHLDQCYLVILSGVALEQQLDFRELGADALIAKGPFAEMRRHLEQVLAMAEQPRIPETSEIPAAARGTDHLHTRQISMELLENNQHLRVILEGMSQGLLEICQGRVAYVNPKACLLLGQPRERLLGRHLPEIAPQPLLDALACVHAQGVVQGEDVDTLVRRIRGTRAQRYADGVMEVNRRGAEAMVRTAVAEVLNTVASVM